MKVPASLKTINLERFLRKQGIFEQQKEYRAMKEAALPLARKLVEGRHKPVVKAAPPRHHQFSNEEVMSYWEKQIHIVETLEKHFDNRVQQFITKIVDNFLNHLESEIATTKSYSEKDKDYFSDNEDDLLAQAQLDFTPLLSEAAVLAGQEAYKLAGVKDVYVLGDLRKRIAENVDKFTQSMLDTDRDTLVNIITDGIKAGRSVPEIRTLIKSDFENITKNQAQRITRTEVLRASNQASIDAYKDSGVVDGLQWLTAGAVDECAQYEGQVVELSGDFYSSESEFADGYPPLHPNCRCVVLPVLIGEKAYISVANKEMLAHIKDLESQIDKRTKEFKTLKSKSIDDSAYIAALEKYLGNDEPTRED